MLQCSPLPFQPNCKSFTKGRAYSDNVSGKIDCNFTELKHSKKKKKPTLWKVLTDWEGEWKTLAFLFVYPSNRERF